MGRNIHHSGTGPSQRQLRVGELIRRALADLLARGEVHDPDLGRMSITVSEVRTSPDLKIATAYVLPLGGAQQEEAIALLARNKPEIRRQLSKALALKYVPDLRFIIDESFDQMDRTRALFDRAEIRRDLGERDE